MEDILYYKDLYDPMEDNEAKSTDKDWQKNKKIISIIRQWLDESVFHHVSKKRMHNFCGKS